MRSPRSALFVLLLGLLAVSAALPSSSLVQASKPVSADQPTIRFATFNASLNRNSAGQLLADLSTPDNTQARTVAEIVQRTEPDVLLINEYDFYEDFAATEL